MWMNIWSSGYYGMRMKKNKENLGVIRIVTFHLLILILNFKLA